MRVGMRDVPTTPTTASSDGSSAPWQLLLEDGISVNEEQKDLIVKQVCPVLCKTHPRHLYKDIQTVMQTGNSKIQYAVRKTDSLQVAIKKVANRADSKLQWYVDNEATMSLLLSNCPGVTQTIACYKTKKNVWIVMEWINGSSLKKLRLFLPMSTSQIAYVIRSILLSLQWMHGRRMAHRDIKSTNIMVDAAGAITLIDLGYATLFTHENPIASDSVGTLLFMAPEVANESGHTCSCDIWSLGVLTYELLLGEPPLYKFDVDSIAQKVALGEPPVFEVPHKNTPISRFIISCMRRFPGTRPSATELLEDPFILSACSDEEWIGAIKSTLPDWPYVPSSTARLI